jgi:hypothetical protein
MILEIIMTLGTVWRMSETVTPKDEFPMCCADFSIQLLELCCFKVAYIDRHRMFNYIPSDGLAYKIEVVRFW